MKKNAVWSINQSFDAEPFQKSKPPHLQWGLELNPLNTPINKMQVKITGDNNVYGIYGFWF